MNTAQISYTTTYATVGYAANLTALAGDLHRQYRTDNPTSAFSPIDSVLESGTKSGYNVRSAGRKRRSGILLSIHRIAGKFGDGRTLLLLVRRCGDTRQPDGDHDLR